MNYIGIDLNDKELIIELEDSSIAMTHNSCSLQEGTIKQTSTDSAYRSGDRIVFRIVAMNVSKQALYRDEKSDPTGRALIREESIVGKLIADYRP